MKQTNLRPVVLAVLAALASPLAHADNTSELGTVTITGEGDKLGAGYLQQDDGVKARSNVSRSSIEKSSPTGNLYQNINMLAGVNASSFDSTGMFGGALTMRGFNSDQIGVTVNGVPVNDSGSFAVYPSEYMDNENLCDAFVTQGSTDTDAPHVGATGGNLGFNSCSPEKQRRFRLAQTLGSNALSRTYGRVDSGDFADGKARAYLSMSHSQVDKWKGEGDATRDHVDMGGRYDLSPGSYIDASLLYNRMFNYNLYQPKLSELQQNGYNADYAASFQPGAAHTNPGPGAQVETAQSPAYYKQSINPFENVIFSANGVFKLDDTTTLKVQPYYWYGYGAGGTGAKIQNENRFYNAATGTLTGTVNLNGGSGVDTDTLDKVLIFSESVTKTNRPGITLSLSKTWGMHQLLGGVWYERAEHRQTSPMSLVNNDGTPVSSWLNGSLVTRADGSLAQLRDWDTISTAYQFFAQDSISLLKDDLNINAGVRAPTVKRDFTHHADDYYSTAPNAQVNQTNYNITQTYSDVLPSLGFRYNLTPSQQVFMNVAKNFKAPPNFAYAPSNSYVQLVGGKVTLNGNIAPETSINTDLGYRYQGSLLTFSGSLFNVDFRNRMANSTDPVTGKSTYINAGDVHVWGAEMELGSAPVNGWSAYTSLTLNRSRILSNIPAQGGTLPTSGKYFPMTPNWMAALSLQYAQGPFFARTNIKHTGKQYATLVNDEAVPEYTTVDFDAGYRFNSVGLVKNPTIKLNLSNVFNTSYRVPSLSSGVKSQSSDGVYYNLGAPRAIAVTLSADL
ncbi:TonB-dependent receptor [Paludibacterium sp. THUN1379]|uniref:TonB-dependent receptor n=1 Tax=Paludibacterium sp. THUN1379 TaxID=3112107 RepID=UPI003088D7C2|nr:TonB-dependent receptor [Paludibacterium sp. THUN1379]